jgi:hypothetical protein
MKNRKIALAGLAIFCCFGCSGSGWQWQRVTPEFRQQLAAQKMAAADSSISAKILLKHPVDASVQKDLAAMKVAILQIDNNTITVQASGKALEKLTAKSYIASIQLPE